MCGCRRTCEGLHAPAITTVVLMRSSLMGPHSFTLFTSKMKSNKNSVQKKLLLVSVDLTLSCFYHFASLTIVSYNSTNASFPPKYQKILIIALCYFRQA